MNRDNTYLKGNKFAKGHKPNKTTFGKGHIPWNKNKKGIRLSPKSEFKKGVRGNSWVPIGTLSIRKDHGSGTRRRYIKVGEPNKWEIYARYLLEQSGVDIRKGLCVHHSNLDSLDDRLDNLVVVSRSEHPKLHNRWNTLN